MALFRFSSDERDLVERLKNAAEPLPDPSEEAFAAAFDRFGDAKVVLLGEASHGTSEFYRARAAITRRLVERHGFTILAVESDWPDAAFLDRYVRDGADEPFPAEAFTRFPRWMWRNEEVVDLLAWLKQWNGGQAPEARVEVRGLDVYSLGHSMQAVLDYLDGVDRDAAQTARERFGCLSPWFAAPERYGREVAFGRKHPCEDKVAEILHDLLGQRMAYGERDGESFFDAAQNARIVRAAEQYYRIMYRGAVESWNLRDRHMFDTLQRLLEHRGPEAKAVVWAHNSHIGNAAATGMGWEGEFNIGELCRKAYRDDVVLVGFSTDRGTVAAASDWDGPMEIKRVRPAREDSHEALFRAAGHPRALTVLRGEGRRELSEALAEPRLERAIGVIYRPETERQSHYFEAVLPEQFDAMVWFEETRAVTALPGGEPADHAGAEAFPSGL
ncbi:erythromycin esterase family protein [Salinarimonas soli]|uniref:Erythromycin esterase family protein n=1 Tax=Salinarimonas soli TaxID=1638099 RepID=A0A5B2V8V4_9HYPH|nr:erythromycin esterase family protein [Salinarimonas soli]KAA2235005.1 erythromycin esterase family protein [Salinarimonas soli]